MNKPQIESVSIKNKYTDKGPSGLPLWHIWPHETTDSRRQEFKIKKSDVFTKFSICYIIIVYNKIIYKDIISSISIIIFKNM